MRGDLLYVCRRCGEAFAGRTMENIELALAVVRGHADPPDHWGSLLAAHLETEQHGCRDGGWGIGDVAGGRPTPAQAGGGGPR